MSAITTNDGTQIFYKDWGAGQPVVFSHGWPLSGDAWDAQMLFLGQQGYRVIAHDRRGHGRSEQSWDGNDLDTYADDLAQLFEQLDLRDAVMVGHSTGGGEVARYIGRHGTARVAKAVLVSAIPPLMLQTEHSPEGTPLAAFDAIRAGVRDNRAQFFRDLSLPFYGYNRPGASESQGVRDSFWLQSMQTGIKGAYDCIKAFSETDLTADLNMTRIAIHGFGRIGRSALRAALADAGFTPVALSDVQDLPTLAALFAVDSNYGRWPEVVRADEGALRIGERSIPYLNARDGLPDWGGLGVDLVIDCTGRAATRAGAQPHLDRGARRVLVSTVSKTQQDADAVLLPGINLDQFDPARHRIVAMGSCTTNALAPVVKVVREQWGLRHGFFTTAHAYTNSQSLTDQPMRDRRDSWAAAENIIPSSSGAARALAFIWPDLIAAFRAAAASAPLQGVMDVLEEEWPSARIVGDPHGSIVDLPLTQVLDRTLLTVAAWYDNEQGFSTQLARTAAALARGA